MISELFNFARNFSGLQPKKRQTMSLRNPETRRGIRTLVQAFVQAVLPAIILTILSYAKSALSWLKSLPWYVIALAFVLVIAWQYHSGTEPAE